MKGSHQEAEQAWQPTSVCPQCGSMQSTAWAQPGLSANSCCHKPHRWCLPACRSSTSRLTDARVIDSAHRPAEAGMQWGPSRWCCVLTEALRNSNNTTPFVHHVRQHSVQAGTQISLSVVYSTRYRHATSLIAESLNSTGCLHKLHSRSISMTQTRPGTPCNSDRYAS